ncbi:MAG: hypothetical protein ACEQSU_07650 [Microgenomates group bacterium]
MKVDEGHDKKGKFFKLGLIDRLALTLENYSSSKFGDRFYSEAFLEGLCERRNESHAFTGKATGGVVVSTTLLAFFDKLEGTTTFMGLTFSIPELGAFALCVLVASNFLVLTFAMIDQLILDRFIYTLGAKIGVHQFELVLLNFTAKNLWSTALMPKYSGLASERTQTVLQGVVVAFYLTLGLTFIAFPVSVVFSTFLSADIKELSLVAMALGVISLTIFVLSFFLVIVFSLNYKFRSSGVSEPSQPFVPENYLEIGAPMLGVAEEK